jgi:ATP-binding cassette subfamily G (WHITE) protein 1
MQVAQTVGVVISCAAPSLQVAVFLAPMTAIPMMLFCGFLIYIDNIPAPLRWIQWLSYFHYCFEACAVAVFKGTPGGDKILSMIGFDNEHTSEFGFDVGMLILFFVVLRCAAYGLLRRQAKRTY